MFPILLIVIGVAVLLLGNRLAVLGAAVGALLGLVLLQLFPGTTDFWVQLLAVGGLALLGFFAAGFARGIIDIVVLVLGALAGAGIVLAFLDLFNMDLGILNWILALIGGVIGFMLMRRGRRGSKDWGMIILSALIGALLIGRGMVLLIPSLEGGIIATIVVIALAALSIIYQGGMIKRSKDAPQVAATTPAPTTSTPVTPPTTSTDIPDAPKSGDSQ